MSSADRKRCFECGASFPPDAHTCDEDRTPLWPDIIGDVWKIEGVIGPRPDGATCAAYHLHTGARVALDAVRGAPHPDPASLKLLTQEVQALRLLEHPSVLRLVEEGTDRAGIHYLATDLGTARPLPDLIEDWQRSSAAGGGPLPPAAISQMGRQILGGLSVAHRLGIAHGSLGLGQIFVSGDEDAIAHLARSGSVRLHGLRALGMGPTLHAAVAADIRAVAAILYELATGKSPPASDSGQVPAMPSQLDPKVAQVILRGLGADPKIHYGSSDEMLRALVVAAPPAASEVSASALAALTRTDPQATRPAPSGEGVATRSMSDPGIGGLPPMPFVSGPHSALPAPPMGAPGEMPVRSRLSGELKQVSFRDLLAQEEGGRKEETLARSRRRVSASSLKLPALPPPPPPEIAAAHEASRAETSSGDNAPLEPTADLGALPVDFASAISGPVLIGSSQPDMKSEISLPPQPLPPEVASARRPHESAKHAATEKPAAKPAEPVKLPEPGQATHPAVVFLEDIDPLARTGQAPIPLHILAAAQRLQQQGLLGSGPPVAPSTQAVPPEPAKPAPRQPPPEKAAAPPPDPVAAAPVVVAPQAPARRPLWLGLVAVAAVVLGLLLLLLRR